jgi:quinolinate synthase
VRALAAERNAVILAHNYQLPEIQDVADVVGDSLGLSQQAAATDADVIVFAGVHFMAETAAILAPDRTVLIPDLEAGCSLAATIDAEALQRWKDENPGAVVVSYVNTTAEVKALSDYCCTSGNARQVIEAVPEDRDILFLPDMFLGAYLERLTGRKMKIWPGECHVHAGIRPEDVSRMMERRPGADLLIHPECGCASQCMYAAAHDAKLADTTHVLSTEGMAKHVASSPKRDFVVATETGILHRLRKEAPEKRFEAMSERAVCRYMKMITLPKLRDGLRDMKYKVTVPEPIADEARLAIQRMVEIV